MTRQNPADLIRGGKLPEKSFPVCVDPDLVAEHEDLVAQRESKKSANAGSLAGGATTDLDEQISEVRKRMEAVTVVLRLRALGRRKWRDLKDEHPPRKDDENGILIEDVLARVNTETFFEPLVHMSIVEPELDEDTVQVLIDEKLTDGQWNDLTTICWNLNETSISVPFSSAASTNRRTTSRR
jgi:hypothetical protein